MEEDKVVLSENSVLLNVGMETFRNVTSFIVLHPIKSIYLYYPYLLIQLIITATYIMALGNLGLVIGLLNAFTHIMLLAISFNLAWSQIQVGNNFVQLLEAIKKALPSETPTEEVAKTPNVSNT